jgi:hypothetical protein
VSALARLAAALLVTVVTLALTFALLYYVGGALVRGATEALILVPRAIVWILTAVQEGADGWAIAGRVASATANALATPQATFSLTALEVVGALALYGLHRLLRDEERSGDPEEDHK